MEEIEKTLAKINARSSATRFPQATRTPFAARNIANSTASSPASFVPIPKLLPEERALLADNGGCFKCRKFWAGHLGVRCTAPPIDGSKYKTLTQKDVPPRPANYNSRSGSTSVAAVLNSDNGEQSTASISEINNENAAPAPLD
ncbi:hypothetical protein EYR38_004914 [Pleurotus pulmonarius]|nr:hypothetical protein EYR38_004914 [Pleurotus pulmonarius]